MKLFVKYIVLLGILLDFLPSEATIWRVNPDPLSAATFSNLQTAVSSPLVFEGDEIHLESNFNAVANGASPYSATINKSLILKGPGYLLSNNFGEFEDMDEVIVGTLSFIGESAGSTISGLTISSLNISANNITVKACSIESTVFSNVNGGTLFGNYMQGISAELPVIQVINGVNLYVAHCIILHDDALDSGQNAVIELGSSSNNEYNHCIIGNANSQIFNGLVHNCIFKGHTFDYIEETEFSNNIFEIEFMPVAMLNPNGSPNDPNPILSIPSNQLDVDLNTVFVQPSEGAPFESQYDIVPGSAASDNSDDMPADNIGVFTVNINGYQPSGQGSFPVLVDLLANTSSDTYLLPVTYSAFSDGETPIVQAEYYFDNDPGFGLASPVTLEATLNISDGFFTADINALTDDFHSIGLRVLDGNGNWSLTEFDEFEKIGLAPLPSLSLISYDFNEGPDFITTIESDNPNEDETEATFMQDFDFSNLPEGINTIRVRATDEFGMQGITFTTILLVLPDPIQEPDLTRVEYWLDIDPGFGEGQQIFIQPGLNLFDEQIDFILENVELGPHKLWVRFKDNNGAWSVSHLEQIHVIDEAFEILDSDNDCNIDVVDLLALLGEFGCSEDPLDVTSECSMDADDNGEVDTTDVLLFLGLFGSTCDTMFPGGPDAQNPNESGAVAQ
jgi:hypothetical protein